MACAAHGCAVVIKGKESAIPLCYAIAANEVGNISVAEIETRTRGPQEVVRRKRDLEGDCASSRRSFSGEWSPFGDGRDRHHFAGIEWGSRRLHAAITASICLGFRTCGWSFQKSEIVRQARSNNTRLRRPATRSEIFAIDCLTRGGKVLLQYSAYGFDRLGYPRWLIKGVLDWKKESQGASRDHVSRDLDLLADLE